jgi:hypothetical protein
MMFLGLILKETGLKLAFLAQIIVSLAQRAQRMVQIA